mmetsp:Transcript_62318/g.103639  ORF Transcript_62318/g.103639 Transcript_62318/m.103639 type:complete len:112 (+) Transcript_62318:314-649(+)
MHTLHKEFGSGLEILLFPSDEFGKQELASEKICPFVQTLGLPGEAPGFHIFEKAYTNGQSTHPVWQFAKAAFPGDVKWNFAAIFLFSKTGICVARTDLMRPPTTQQIKALL